MGSVDKCKRFVIKGFPGMSKVLQRVHCHRRVNIINNHQFKNKQLYNCSSSELYRSK